MLEEQLAKIAGKSQSFDETGGGFGGMTVQDLAAALSGANPIGLYILWVRYIDKEVRGLLGFGMLQSEAVTRVYKADKIPKKKDMITPLLEIAIQDYIGDHICPFCKGRREIIEDNGKIHHCRSKHCIDGKVRQRKDWQRAQALGVPALDYSRHYKATYRVIDKYLTEVLPEAETAAYNHVKKQAKWHD